MVKGAIFDLDGVIVDTAKYHYLAWAEIAHDLGFEFTLAHNEALKGVGRMESLDILLSVGGLSDSLSGDEKQKLAQRKNRRYIEMVSAMNANEISCGVHEFICELRDNGIKIALGSSSKNAELVLERLNIISLFDAIVDGTMISRSKPDPQIFLMGAEKIKCEAASCVVFEDAESGVEAAHRAGMKCIGVGGELPDADIHISDFKGYTYNKFKTFNL